MELTWFVVTRDTGAFEQDLLAPEPLPAPAETSRVMVTSVTHRVHDEHTILDQQVNNRAECHVDELDASCGNASTR